MPVELVPTTAFASVYITAPSGPSSMQPSGSSTASPGSPMATSHAQQHPSGKPPISPPSIHHSMPRISPLTSGVKTTLPALSRLPSLSTVSMPQQSSLRPSVLPIPTTTRALPLQSTAPKPSPSVPTPSEAPTPRELAARLALLLHARECCTPFDMERVCGVRNCRVARGVLDHCQECFLPEGQCHRSCSEAKQLLRHFRVCRAQQFQRPCSVCDILRSEFAWAMQHARSLTPLFVDAQQQTPTYVPQRRHSYQPPRCDDYDVPTSLRRSVSDGPHATMSATGHHHKRTATSVYQHTKPVVKRVRIVTPTEEAAAAAAAAASATSTA